MTEIRRPVVMPFADRTVEIIEGKEHIDGVLSAEEREQMMAVLVNPSAHGIPELISSADGRNIYFPLIHQSGPYTHIQLSGGFFAPHAESSMKQGAAILPATIFEPKPEAYGDTHPSNYSTIKIVGGKVCTTGVVYEPTGGYTFEGASGKNSYTRKAERRLAQGSLLTPQALCVYSTQRSGEIPIHGFASLCIDPNDRYNPRVRVLVHDMTTPDKLFADISEMYSSFAQQLPIVHAKDLTHGQPHPGNFGIARRSNQGYLADWSTLTDHRKTRDDLSFEMAKFLDLHVLAGYYIDVCHNFLPSDPLRAITTAINHLATAYRGNPVNQDDLMKTIIEKIAGHKTNPKQVSAEYLQAGAKLISGTSGTVVDMGKQQHGKGRRK